VFVVQRRFHTLKSRSFRSPFHAPTTTFGETPASRVAADPRVPLMTAHIPRLPPGMQDQFCAIASRQFAGPTGRHWGAPCAVAGLPAERRTCS